MCYYHVYSHLSGLGYDAVGLDARVRCLSYLMRHVAEISTVPPNTRLGLFVPRYPGPVPAIGLTEDPPVDGPSVFLSRRSRQIGEEIEAFTKQIGLEQLLERSSQEEVCWSDLLTRAQAEWDE